MHGTLGFRLRVDHWVGKDKLSQDKAPEVVERIIGHLEGDGVYANAELAERMRASR